MPCKFTEGMLNLIYTINMQILNQGQLQGEAMGAIPPPEITIILTIYKLFNKKIC